MRRKRVPKIYVVSIALHVALGLGLAFIPKQKLREVVAIALAETPKDKPKPAEPPKHEERPKERPARAEGRARTASQNAPPPSGANAGEQFTNIGLSLDSNALGGVAVPIAAQTAEPVKPVAVERPKPKMLSARASADSCTAELVKARPLQLSQPQYTNAARRARVEGRVRVEVIVDESGAVKQTTLLSGLGYGLDEAALAAAERIRFRPATRCGRAVEAPFVISMRFVLGT